MGYDDDYLFHGRIGTAGSFQQLYNIHFHWHRAAFPACASQQQTHSHRHLVHYIHRTGRPALLCDWTGHGFGLAFWLRYSTLSSAIRSASGVCQAATARSRQVSFDSSALPRTSFGIHLAALPPASWAHSHHSPLHRRYEATLSSWGCALAHLFGGWAQQLIQWRRGGLSDSSSAQMQKQHLATTLSGSFRQQHSCNNSQRLTPTGSLRAT